MRRSLPVVITVAILIAIPSPSPEAIPKGTRVQTYKGGLDFPVDMAWVEGTKKIFFTEKNTGKVRVLKRGNLLSKACVNLDVNSAGERGALGITLHPRFQRNHYLYVYYAKASPLENRVTRFTVRNDRCRNPMHIVTGIDASSSGYHNGGQLEFVGGKLFVATGEAHSPAEAQDTGNRLGKILRYKPNGSVPDDNPFSTPVDPSPVWSYGHRNPFGLARKPGTNKLYASENGPSCDDEVNRILRGRNYGWGSGYQCGTSGVGANPKGPMKRWTPPIVPTDLWWYKGKLRALSGNLFMGDFNDGRLHKFVLNGKGTRIKRDRIVYNASEGIVDVAKGPGGWLYFLTPSVILRIVR